MVWEGAGTEACFICAPFVTNVALRGRRKVGVGDTSADSRGLRCCPWCKMVAHGICKTMVREHEHPEAEALDLARAYIEDIAIPDDAATFKEASRTKFLQERSASLCPWCEHLVVNNLSSAAAA